MHACAKSLISDLDGHEMMLLLLDHHSVFDMRLPVGSRGTQVNKQFLMTQDPRAALHFRLMSFPYRPSQVSIGIK